MVMGTASSKKMRIRRQVGQSLAPFGLFFTQAYPQDGILEPLRTLCRFQFRVRLALLFEVGVGE